MTAKTTSTSAIAQNFDQVFVDLVRNLSSLLEADLLPGEEHADSPVGLGLAAIAAFHGAGDQEHRDWNVLRLALLEKQLRVLRSKRRDVFAAFRDRLLRDDEVHYFGTRCELLVAANLAYLDVRFSQPDPPDFEVDYGGTVVALECTSAHVQGADPQRLRVKIRKALNRKVRSAEKHQHRLGGMGNLAVGIDVTNLYHHSDRRGRLFLPPDLEDYLHARLSQVRLGSCLVFTMVLDRPTDTFKAVQLRIDGSSLTPGLKALLDFILPINRSALLQDYVFPPVS